MVPAGGGRRARLLWGQRIALVAYSPVGRGFLAGGVRDMTRLSERDIRHGMPRFKAMRLEQPESFRTGRNTRIVGG